MTSGRDRRYDAERFLEQLPTDRGDLFRGVVAWQEDVAGWRRSVRENLQEGAGRIVRRTVWDDPARGDARIAVDVVECSSAAEALAALADRLEWNQLRDLPEGPAGLGTASFMHPEGVSPAIFFARDNLCISVVSFAPRAVSVEAVAAALDRRLTVTPSPGPVALPVEREPPDRGATPIRVEVPFPLAEDGYLQFSARGGTVEIRDDAVVAIPGGPEEMRVDVYAIEPGRAAAAGRLVIPR